MALVELESTGAVETFKSTNATAIICFSATWCGPCRNSKPQLETFASTYSSDATKVGIVYEHTLGTDTTNKYNITCFPTYVLFAQTVEKGRIEGVRFPELEQLLQTHLQQQQVSAGPGYSLGGDTSSSTSIDAEEARKRRLARFQTSSSPSPVVKDKDVGEPKPTATASKTTATTVTKEDKEDATKAERLDTLTNAMGFSLVRAQKALLYSKGDTVESAMEWLEEHQEDDDIDDPINECAPCDSKPAAGGIVQSYKCNECQKVFSNMANLELHANKTGHSDFEESTTALKPMTEEEKAKKLEQVKELLQQKRKERLAIEQKDNVQREKQRRFTGQEMKKTREQMDMEKRKRDTYMRKKQKEDSRKERLRIKREIEKDKLERRANKGKMQSRLGIDGYNPDGIQYDVTNDETEETKTKKKVSKTKSIEDHISKIASYKAGGDGGKCLKILLVYINNLLKNPNEMKFKTINMDNKAYKNKVKPFVGAKSLLLTIGFKEEKKSDGAGNVLVYSMHEEDEMDCDDNDGGGGGVDEGVLNDAKEKLEAAFAAY